MTAAPIGARVRVRRISTGCDPAIAPSNSATQAVPSSLRHCAKRNFNLALGLADHITVLNTGRVVFDGPADGVRAAPEQVTKHVGVF